MVKLYGWAGKILKVDLSEERATTIPTTKYVPKFIGGRGLAAKLYWDEVPNDPEIGALDPENALIFMTGPLTGTGAPSSGRVICTGKAPVTFPLEFYMRSSAGGHWGPELKFAGYDGIIVKGKAPELVYLWIHDKEVEFRFARLLSGQTTYAVQEEIWRRHGERTRVVTTGPVADKLGRCAVILTDDGNTFGHGGYGAVMGSKNLKAIAVRGTGSILVARPKDLLEKIYRTTRLMTRKEWEKEPPNPKRSLARRIELVHGPLKLQEEADRGEVRLGFCGCFTCPVLCGTGVKFMDGSITGGGASKCMGVLSSIKYEKLYYGKEPGYKPWGRVAWEGCKLPDLLGINNWLINMVYPWFHDFIKEGILTNENTGLTTLDKVGSIEFLREIYFKVANREGIGDLLSEGAARFIFAWAEKLEKEGDTEKARKAIEIYESYFTASGKFGGLYAPLSYVKDSFGMIYVAVQTSNRPHNDNLGSDWYEFLLSPVPLSCRYIPPRSKDKAARELFGSEKALDPYTWDYAIPRAIVSDRYRVMSDSLPYCEWPGPLVFSQYTPDKLGDVTLYTKMYSAVTGIDITHGELFGRVAERLRTVERCIQVREGRTTEDDWYFDCVFEQNKAWTNKEGFRNIMDKYYRTRGWDIETGIPTREKLTSLGLHEIADELRNYGI